MIFEYVFQWCPDCDCLRRCRVVGDLMIECDICRGPIVMSAENARILRSREKHDAQS